VNNFDESREPRVLELPVPGTAGELSAAVDKLIDNLLQTFSLRYFEHTGVPAEKMCE